MPLLMLICLLAPPAPTPTPTINANNAAKRVKPGWSGAKDATGRRVGLWVRHSVKRVKLEEARYDAQGLRHGEQIAFGATGQACGVERFTHGTGTLVQYTPDCIAKTRKPLVNGWAHGRVERFDRQGRPVSVVRYVHGFPHGMAERWQYPTRGPEKKTYRCMYAGQTIWQSVHGGPVDACAVESIGGIGVKRSALYRRTIKGLSIEQIFSKGPAAQSALKVGDVLVAIGDRRLPGPSAAETHRLLTGAPGSVVTLVVRRDKAEKQIPITVQVLDLAAWRTELAAAARARPSRSIELLNVPEPRFPGRGM